MSNINFPSSPVLNQIHNENDLSWKWNGFAWVALGRSIVAPSGGIGYGNGSGYLFSAPGNSGEFLMSNGPNAPVWSTIPPDSIATVISFW